MTALRSRRAIATAVVMSVLAATALTNPPPPPAVPAAAVVYVPASPRLAGDRPSRSLAEDRPATPVSSPTAPAPSTAPPARQRAVRTTVHVTATKARPPVRRPAAPAPAVPAPAPAHGSAAAVVAFVLAQLGKPYVFGAAGPRSYDCSGLAMAAYVQVGVSLPHSSGAMLGYGRPVSQADLQPGDLIFPGGVGHVAIYIGGGRMVHAPHSGASVEVISVYSFWAARRVL